MSKEVTDEGTALVEEFMRTWAQRSASTAGTQSQEDDEADTTGEGGARKKRRMDPQTELEELRKCVEEFRPRMQANVSVGRQTSSFPPSFSDVPLSSHTLVHFSLPDIDQPWAAKVLESF